MKFLIYIGEGFKIAFEALRSYKMRSMLTTLGVVIGVMTVITIVTLVQGLNTAFKSELSSIGTNTLYINKYPWVFMSQEDWIKVRNRPNITLEEAQKVKEWSRYATAVAPTLNTRRNAKYKERTIKDVTVIGTTEDYLLTSNTFPEKGRFLSSIDVNHRRAVCVLGQDVVDELFPFTDPVGKRINLGGRKFVVIGVSERKGKMFGQSQDQMAIVPIEVFHSAYGARWRSVSIEVQVSSPEFVDDAETELTGLMRRIRGLPPEEENNFSVNQQSTLVDTYNNITKTLWAVAIGVGTISLLVGGIGIMNILLVSVTERTREIGVRKALGARRSHIMVQFLVESIMICALGVLIGIGLALVLAKIIEASTPLPAAVTGWVMGLGFLFVFTIGIFFGLYPASKAARLNPIDALRYE